MEDFQDQVKRNLLEAVSTFNSDKNLDGVRDVYKTNFDEIRRQVISIGSRPAIEDIQNYDPTLESIISSNFLLLKDVNEGIRLGLINENNIA